MLPAVSGPTSRGQKLIYLVDDEDLLLEMAAVALQHDGYELKKFQDPEAAYASFANEAAKPSLLLTDYAMESMTGVELSEKCKGVSIPT
jgi:DNA-binding NtrC family response regulator